MAHFAARLAATAIGLLALAAPAQAASDYGYVPDRVPTAAEAVARRAALARTGLPAAAVLAMPGAGQLGYTAEAARAGVAFAAAHRPAFRPTVSAAELLRRADAGRSGYEVPARR